MTIKLLIAALIAYAGWRLWHDGWGRARTRVAAREPAALAEARAVLGLAGDPSEAEIRAAHRRLVAAVHPDRGGSAELTRRINDARDVLLKARSA
ncbi:MAG: hypothetical protein A4S12_12580 [Proteobacteria bacterium SG_bin5]|nr:J domain-containing protein [Sphingomonas sp.]OQW38524.1 MAG: hypothetical protein A4S12_12580 [Proteobacteria bacterium SG_bin5]